VTRDGKFYTTICKADEEDIKGAMERSPNEEMIARELQKTNYGLGADFVQLINEKLNSDVVESVNYTLNSVNVLEIPEIHSTVLSILFCLTFYIGNCSIKGRINRRAIHLWSRYPCRTLAHGQFACLPAYQPMPRRERGFIQMLMPNSMPQLVGSVSRRLEPCTPGSEGRQVAENADQNKSP
jgi:hypothetical protein